ncbi:hypothetical protein L1987_50308 [Smallanthus sonchifolius]|uniref:Uncharacterized protein n=1 Tax=Smallanthus sonchifolius TaxID=185202 RepID=A0ACB9EML4_9ASTR|nr:hypothetical protein L1987_50308 [Smallanthus sonchifolius]
MWVPFLHKSSLLQNPPPKFLSILNLFRPKQMEEFNRNEQESKNDATMNALYKSLAAGDTKIVSGLLATDLEWWFHGPQNGHHMMRMLTGEAPHTEFKFEPRCVTTLDDHIMIVEGYEGARWVDKPV